jgi:hypothetical protein
MNLCKKDKIKHWSLNDSVYFRHLPYFLDFCIIMVLASLNVVDGMYLEDQKKFSDPVKISLYSIALKKIRTDYPSTYMFLLKLKERSQVFLILCVFIYVGTCLPQLQVSIMSWIFFICIVLIVAMIGKIDNKSGTLNNIVYLSTAFKGYTTIIIILEVLFISIFGSMPSKTNSYD